MRCVCLCSMFSTRGLFGFRRLGSRLLQSYASPTTVLVDEFNARSGKHASYKSKASRITCIPPDLDVRDGVAMESCRFRQISDGPVQGGACHSYLCTCHSSLIVLLSHVL
jgi:hypothetical protein